MIKGFFARVCYRLWQFKQVLLPRLDLQQWHEAIASLEKPLQAQLNLLRKSEKAHVVRVYQAIGNDKNLEISRRQELLQLALLHDIGKTVTRPSLLFKVAKVFFACANTEHCLAGASILRKHHQNSILIRRVLRHHDTGGNDPLVKAFQHYDDAN